MNLDKAIEAQIFANNKKISKLLEENEALLRRAGFNPPVENVALPSTKRSSFLQGIFEQ